MQLSERLSFYILFETITLVCNPIVVKLSINRFLVISMYTQQHACYCKGYSHRVSINRPTKRRKEKLPSDGHCQCEKKMDDHLLACQQILEKESHIVTRLAKERTSFLNINDNSFFGTPDCHHCCSIA
jgi:hypothetical protein